MAGMTAAQMVVKKVAQMAVLLVGYSAVLTADQLAVNLVAYWVVS